MMLCALARRDGYHSAGLRLVKGARDFFWGGLGFLDFLDFLDFLEILEILEILDFL